MEKSIMLKQLQARLKEIFAKQTELEALTEMTVDQLDEHQKLCDEADKVSKQIDQMTRAEQQRAVAAAPADATVGGDGRLVSRSDNHPPSLVDIRQSPTTQLEKISLIASATLKATLKKIPTLKVLEDEGYGAFAKTLGDAMRARAMDTTAIDVLIPDPVSGDIIEFLRPEMTFLQGGPRRVQFTNGKFKQPRATSGATAAYVGEGQKKPVSDITFDEIDMRARKIAGIVLITDEARDWSLPNIDSYIRDDLRRSLAQTMDMYAYFGMGGTNSPLGIFSKPGVPTYNADDISADDLHPTVVEVDRMLAIATLSLQLKNLGRNSNWAWLMNPRTSQYLRNMRVGDTFTGQYAYPEMNQNPPSLKGIRVLETNVIPINQGNTTDETTIALVDFSHVLYAEEGGITVKSSDQATIDVNGTLTHLFQQNMYAILAEHQHDFGLRYTGAVAVLDGVRWGADMVISPGSP